MNLTVSSPLKEELHSPLTPEVRTGLGLMHLVIKNFTLYPETNSIRYQSLENFHNWLTKYLEENETLRLIVERDSLVFEKDIVFQDKTGEMPMVGPLFRDGIQWFEFLEGVEFGEVETLINLICRFRVLKDEAEDDLATALWEAELLHISHKTADEFWEADPMAELKAMKNLLDSNDEQEANIQAHVSAGSKTVGMVLDALNRDKNQDNQANSSNVGGSGFAPGAGGAAGQEVDLSAQSEGGGSQEGELPQVLVAQAADGDSAAAGETVAADAPGAVPAGEAQAQTSPQPPPAPGAMMVPARPDQAPPPDDDVVEHEMTELFASLLSDLDSSVAASGAKRKSGSAAGQMSKKHHKDSNLVVVNDEDIEAGVRQLPGFIDDDDGDVTYTDAAMAEALFKASTYFDTQGESPFWRLTREETARLRMMIAYEEARSNTSDCLDILLILINALNRQDERMAVVDFIADEAQYALANGDIIAFRKFLEQLEDESEEVKPWLPEVVVELKKRISTPEILEVLADPVISDQVTPEFLADLKSFLMVLAPESVYALVPILSKVGDQKMDKVITQAVAHHACRLTGRIDTLIGTMKSSLLKDFIGYIREDNLPYSPQLILSLTRNESPVIREEAARLLLDTNPENVKNLFHLIDDPSLAINQLICFHMSQTRNPLAERILLDYIGDHFDQSRNRSRGHVLNCYRALGLCTSPQTMNFLSEVLMKKDWKAFLGFDSQWHRVGAALALMLMPAEWGVDQVLTKASQSRLRNIRQAYEQARDMLNDGWILNNE